MPYTAKSTEDLNNAILTRNVKKVTELLKNFDKDNINNPCKNDFEKKRPVDCAAENGTLEIINLLKEKGANFTTINEETKLYPIHCVLQRELKNSESTNECKMILEKLHAFGVDFEVKDQLQKKNPIHHAILHNNFMLIQILSELGSDINSEDREGNTPLKMLKQKFKDEIPGDLLRFFEEKRGKVYSKNTETFCTEMNSRLQPDTKSYTASQNQRIPENIQGLANALQHSPNQIAFAQISRTLNTVYEMEKRNNDERMELISVDKNKRSNSQTSPGLNRPAKISKSFYTEDSSSVSTVDNKLTKPSITNEFSSAELIQIKSIVSAIFTASKQYPILVDKMTQRENKDALIKEIIKRCESEKELPNKIKDPSFYNEKMAELKQQIGLESNESSICNMPF